MRIYEHNLWRHYGYHIACRGAVVTVITAVNRLMACPEGWVPPEGYSDED